jgi:iron-sulfur cluster repair protein YtfE (RIC family)
MLGDGNREPAKGIVMATEENQVQAGADTITGFMDAEHTRLRDLWERTTAALNAEEFGKLHSLVRDLIAALKRHISVEEQILFPAIESKSKNNEPTNAMRLEHRQMEHMLEQLKPLLTVAELWTGIKAVEGQEIEPGALLRSHENKEHDVLFPLADRLLASEEVRTLVARMRTAQDKG